MKEYIRLMAMICQEKCGDEPMCNEMECKAIANLFKICFNLTNKGDVIN